jgi:hypothetical protein
VVDPTDAHREAARPAAGDEPLQTPWGCLRMAVVWSGGSLNDAGLPVVAPADYATPRAVAGAIMLAGVFPDPIHYEERYRQFLDLGLHIAARRNLWWQSAAAGQSEADGLADLARVGEARRVEGIPT